MVIEGYGINLVRLTSEEIELVRKWRNADEIRQYMEHREPITAEMQEKWFRSINTAHHNYFLIGVGDLKIGLIYGSDINWETGETGNGGIFIWDKRESDFFATLRASLLLTDLSFLLGLNNTYIKVLRDNRAAISYNLNLGYKLLSGQEEMYNQRYVLSRENYFKKTNNIRKVLLKSEKDPIRVIVDDSEHPASKKIVEKYLSLTDAEQLAMIFTFTLI